MGAQHKRPKHGIMGWLQSAVLGFVQLWTTILGIDGKPIISEIIISVLFCVPISIACSYWVFAGGIRWDNTLHVMMGAALGFLLVFRLQTAYNRFWEARGHVELAIQSCRSIAVLVITQYHRHYGDPGFDVPKCVDDIRRYIMMYFFCMIYQLIDVDVRQKAIEELLTQQELQLLLRTPRARAITCVKWVAARLAHLEALGYMAPLQLHETNEGLQGMITAFNGLTKIKTTPTPFAIRQLCSVLAVVYVYFAPLALANEFSNILDQYWSVMLRTMLSSVLLGFAILGMNQTASVLEDPWRNSESDLPLVKIGTKLNEELLSLFAEPIPPLVGPDNMDTKAGVAEALIGARPTGSGSRGGRIKEIDGTATN